MQAQVFTAARAQLGEGPVWDGRRQCLWWTDIHGKCIHRTEMDGHDRCYSLEGKAGTIGLTEGEELLLAMTGGVCYWHPETGARTLLCRPETDKPFNRFNDGKPGPGGHFLIGTMDDREPGRDTGALYRVEPDGSSQRLIGETGISNGLDWSPDGKTLYYIDTPTRVVRAYAYDAVSGEIAAERVAVRLAEGEGGPDGMTVDAAGRLWGAQWGGGQVGCYDGQTGEKLAAIDVPATRVSCPAFGGPDLRTLFITTASDPQGDEAAAGQVMACRVEAVGKLPYRFPALRQP